MALVGYSDSEGSDAETPVVAPAQPKPAPRISKTTFQKVTDPSAPRKIKVDLPLAKPEKVEAEEPPPKRARIGGLGGFNSFLPAPKRSGDAAAKPKGLGSGISLRTGAEPAFSRERPEPPTLSVPDFDEDPSENATTDVKPAEPILEEKPKEVKTVGNAMRFKPLSVVKKKAPVKKPATASITHGETTTRTSATQPTQQARAPPPPKPKVSLFSVSQEDAASSTNSGGAEYQPLLAEAQPVQPEAQPEYDFSQAPANPNSLDAIANDLNLSASARRQLFGRNKEPGAMANIMHFNTDEEYKLNEQLRAQGQAAEHRAVKSVAPGKHSLQQLVSAANTQKDALEDAWAEGKRNKAEGGSRYGW